MEEVPHNIILSLPKVCLAFRHRSYFTELHTNSFLSFFLSCFLFSRHGVWGPEVAISHRILRYSPPPTFKGSDRRSQINTKQLTGRRRRYTILQRLGRRDQRGLYYRRHTVLAGSVHRGEIAILPAPGARKSSVLILMVMGHY